MALTRRTLLLGSAAVAMSAASVRGPLRAAPFTLGIASGDPEPDGVVLWTRLAPQPLNEDGRGGMPARDVLVEWEVATDEQFQKVVRRGAATARAADAHTVHVEVRQLTAGSEFFYRFRAEGHLSPAGRTRTAPPPTALPGNLAMSFVSCAHYEHGYFTAYRHLAEDEPELILHLGDYQYDSNSGDDVIPGGLPRQHLGPEARTLAGYRRRYAEYKTDPDLQAAHAVAPWSVVFDDHEVDNNWAGRTPEQPDPHFLTRRTAAFRAYYENMPLRRASIPRGAGIRVYRRLAWGRLATFHLLDTRQFRDDQACGDLFKDCPAASDPARTITGAAQEKWLLDGFRRSEARWDVLGQQVFFGQRDLDAGPKVVTSMDAWDGYVASRERITRGWVDAGVRNPVVLTGDVHAHWAGDLKLDYNDPATRTVGAELVCSSISSGGDGADHDPAVHPWMSWNPNLRFYNNQRGYVRTRVTPDTMTADFRSLPYVTSPGAPAHTRATFVVEDRVAGLQQIADDPTPPSG